MQTRTATLQTDDAVQTYALHMTGDAARVILNDEGSRLEYTPATKKLEVVLRSRGLLLTGLTMVMPCYIDQDGPTSAVYEDDGLGTFFDSKYWHHLITGHTSLECFMISGTPTTGLPFHVHYRLSIRAHARPYTWFMFEFSRQVVEQGLSYDRAILREHEYIHEYTNDRFDRYSENTAALVRHRANLVALQERRLAVMMSLHPRLGDLSGLCHLDIEDEIWRDICDRDI